MDLLPSQRCGFGTTFLKVRRALPVVRLEPKPRNCEVNARDHRWDGGHPQQPRPEPACPSVRQERSDETKHECSDCGRGRPAVPVHFGGKQLERRVDDIPETMQAHHDDPERGIEGE
jgi:hypothetical protein